MSEALKLDLGTHALRARRVGSGKATIVCLHGFLESGRAFDALASELEDRRQVISIDQRGHGESTAPPGAQEWEYLADDVAAALDILGLEHVTLLGHSMGGLVALHTALRWPERIDHLALIATPADSSAFEDPWLGQVIKAGERDGLRGIARQVYGPLTDREIAGELEALMEAARLIERGDGGVGQKLAEIVCPTLAIVGSEDPLGVPAVEHVARGVCDGLLEVIDAQGHWPHRNAPQSTATRIAAFLSGNQREV